MYRFFVRPADIQDDTIKLSDEDFRHIRSLRLRPSEFFVVCDGEGSDFVCRLADRADVDSFDTESRNFAHGARASAFANCYAEIFDRLPSKGEPTVKCSVYIAYSKGDRLDYAVQKSVELGAYEIVLFESARCVSIPADTQKKIARLQKIALETAKQCNRGRVPSVFSAKSFSDAVALAAQADLPLFFYELEESNGLRAVLERASADTCGNPIELNSISIMTGPEGGFEPNEAEHAKSAGLFLSSLGSRILRSETAPVAALAAIMFFYNEM